MWLGRVSPDADKSGPGRPFGQLPQEVVAEDGLCVAVDVARPDDRVESIQIASESIHNSSILEILPTQYLKMVSGEASANSTCWNSATLFMRMVTSCNQDLSILRLELIHNLSNLINSGSNPILYQFNWTERSFPCPPAPSPMSTSGSQLLGGRPASQNHK